MFRIIKIEIPFSTIKFCIHEEIGLSLFTYFFFLREREIELKEINKLPYKRWHILFLLPFSNLILLILKKYLLEGLS